MKNYYKYVTSAEEPSRKNTILFYGNSMVERLLEQGELEARLQIARPKSGIKIRSLAWTGDEVGNRLRLEGYAQHMKNLLAEWPADTIILGYGLNESFTGEEGLDDFKKQYETHLKQLSKVHPNAQFVILSPIAIEGASENKNNNVKAYSLAAYAKSEPPLTIEGIHLNTSGVSLVAAKIAGVLQKSSEPDPNHLREVALAAAAKHRRVADVVRPKNAVVYFGVRKRPKEYAEEMPRYHKMIELTEKVVHRMAADATLIFSEISEPKLDPLVVKKGRDDGKRTGIIKKVAEQMEEFTVADGYKVNLFASEEDFPELRNPVQITFDARGRLWVVTMPSFPHTVPGLTPPDKILILEDTDQDGKADKSTVYMEGLDAVDGVAFHRDGVIISEQPRLWFTKDTDGDDRMDVKIELLRGIDVTDSHHGGMIATDPMGDIIFCDGVFHRSQFETRYGVHRGIDATTYRLDPITGKINSEWQHITPNPWKVTFDRWGGVFQMYGDGIFFDTTALPWTPLGAYHPFKYARIASYGKGSGITTVSSPNFPERYQQGMASAALLGRYAVTLTAFDYEPGLIKGKDPLTLISSPNAAFRPADLEFGMDGALYVSDFCSPIIGHAQHAMRNPNWDHNHGRIWRVVNTKKALVKEWPKIKGASGEDLCKLLLHPQNIVRHHARIELRKKGLAGLKVADAWVAGIEATSPDYDQAALEVLFVGAGLQQVRPALLDGLLQSKSFQFRRAAVHFMRVNADLLGDVEARLASMVTDAHPRVQMEVIGAIAHLRQKDEKFSALLQKIPAKNKHVKKTLQLMDYGTEPLKGRSVPVLNVDKKSELTMWLRYEPGGKGEPVVHTSKKPSGGVINLYRTFVNAEKECTGIIGINHKSLDIRVNDIVKFSQNSIWSGDQQVQIDLVPGLNVIEVELLKPSMGRPKGKGLPNVYLYDATGEVIPGIKMISNTKGLLNLGKKHDKMLADRGQVLNIQAAPGLQFAPTEMSVEAGSTVRIVFANPDTMLHNFLLLSPGSVEEIGASSKVLLSSRVLGPDEKQELSFVIPNEPGDYPYICTFPGHWRVMKGVLKVLPKK